MMQTSDDAHVFVYRQLPVPSAAWPWTPFPEMGQLKLILAMDDRSERQVYCPYARTHLLDRYLDS